MKLPALLFALSVSFFNLCLAQSKHDSAISKPNDKLLETALVKAGSNRASLEQVLQDVPENMKEGAVFLISYMP